jgi:outer membrane protein OmpA-like peptidoglycan-associated protein
MAIAKQFMCLSRRLSLVSFSFVLAACAQNQISSDTSVVVNGQTESRADKAITSSNNKIDNNVSSNSGGSNKITQQDRSLDYANMNPVPIMFDKLSIKLDEDGKQIVTAIGERAKMASKIIITGYCDRNQVGNAKDAAIARANAVKEDLVSSGVSAKKIRIKFITSVTDKHGVEIEF